MKKYIPILLLYSRLLLVIIILAVTLMRPAGSRFLVLALMYFGILTDIFDGIIARKLNVSNQRFRLLDTIFDLFFYLSILFFVFSVNPESITENVLLICCILALEGTMYFTSIARFGKLPHFGIALVFGLVAHLDRVFIYLLIKKWDHDIPSSYHALLLRQGKQISRKKIFNG